MTTVPEFRLLKAATAADAVKLRQLHPGSRFLAGGTDLLPNLRRGLVKSEVLIDIAGIAEMSGIRQHADRIEIGAATTLAAIAGDPAVAARLPALAQAASSVAGPTHRSAGTIGGNLCLDTRCRYYNQSEDWRRANDYCMKLDGDACRVAKRSKKCLAAFSGDLAPALMVLDASVELVSPAGKRLLPMGELYADDGAAWLTLGADEIVGAVHVPLNAGWISGYEKVRVRQSIDFPLAGVAVALARQGSLVAGLRIACTGIGSRPMAVEALEELVGKPLGEAALRTVVDQVELIVNGAVKTTIMDALYRKRVPPRLARRLVEALWDDAL